MVICDTDETCDDMSLAMQLSPDCLQCLVANDGGGGGMPSIAPCLTLVFGCMEASASPYNSLPLCYTINCRPSIQFIATLPFKSLPPS